MSILINMEMPTSCNKCPMHFYEGQGICSCRVLGAIEDGEVLKPWKKRRKDCPLVPVPKHGRLIDADELFKEMERKGWFDNADRDIAEDLVLAAPTIIPAEEGE